MATMFWAPPAASSTVLSDAEFFSFTTEGQAVSRAQLSKTIMKKAMPELFWRKYTAKFSDFTRNQSSFFLIPKKNVRDDEIYWKPIANEFDAMDNASFGYTQFAVGVEERALRFPFTKRAKLLANVDIEAEIVAQAKNSIVASIERDLVANAFLYLDVLGVCDLNGAVGITQGKSILPDKTFSSQANPINITQATVNTTAGTVEGVVVQNMTMSHILAMAKALSDRYCTSYNGNGYGNYIVIVNETAYNRLLTDPVFYNAVSYGGDPDRLYTGYLGSFYGQEFILDKTKMLTRIAAGANSWYSDKAIAVFLGKDAVYEAIALPEQVLPLETADHGRFMSYAIQTYRGETPIWFASTDSKASGGVLIGK